MLRKIIFCILIMVCNFSLNVSAQTDLTKISDEMYRDNNVNYLIVDAYKDGLLKENEEYEFEITEEIVGINGISIGEPLQTLYIDKWRVFTAQKNGNTTGKIGSTRIQSTFRLADVENPKSSLRSKPLRSPENIEIFNRSCIASIEDKMIAEHLINERTGYSIDFTNNKLLVNDKQLPDELDKKYVSLFTECRLDGNERSSIRIGKSGNAPKNSKKD